MMEFKININCDNAAFCDIEGEEVARILEGVVCSLRHQSRREFLNMNDNLIDFNGNTVGKVDVT